CSLLLFAVVVRCCCSPLSFAVVVRSCGSLFGTCAVWRLRCLALAPFGSCVGVRAVPDHSRVLFAWLHALPPFRCRRRACRRCGPGAPSPSAPQFRASPRFACCPLRAPRTLARRARGL